MYCDKEILVTVHQCVNHALSHDAPIYGYDYNLVIDTGLLDSSMVNEMYTGWISFNVIGAVRY